MVNVAWNYSGEPLREPADQVLVLTSTSEYQVSLQYLTEAFAGDSRFRV